MINRTKKTIRKLYDAESSLTLEIERDINNKFVKWALFIITEIGSSISAGIIFIVLAFISGIQVLYVFVPVYLFQLAIVEAIKLILQQPRPKSGQKNLFGLAVASGSFPSGHTSNIFTIAFLISNYYQFGILETSLIFSIAGLVAFSRIVLRKHYIIDVLCGGVIGLLLAICGSLILPNFLYYVI